MSTSRTLEIDGRDVDVPQEFICPITLQVMTQPLVNKRGMNFERAAILSWLGNGAGLCPLTRLPMKPSDLIPNRSLEIKIKVWKKQNALEEDETEAEAEDMSLVGFLSVSNSQMDEFMARKKDSQSHHAQAIRYASVNAEASVLRLRERARRRVYLSRVLAAVTQEMDDL